MEVEILYMEIVVLYMESNKSHIEFIIPPEGDSQLKTAICAIDSKYNM